VTPTGAPSGPVRTAPPAGPSGCRLGSPGARSSRRYSSSTTSTSTPPGSPGRVGCRRGSRSTGRRRAEMAIVRRAPAMPVLLVGTQVVSARRYGPGSGAGRHRRHRAGAARVRPQPSTRDARPARRRVPWLRPRSGSDRFAVHRRSGWNGCGLSVGGTAWCCRPMAAAAWRVTGGASTAKALASRATPTMAGRSPAAPANAPT
jgi:hypothetical protein